MEAVARRLEVFDATASSAMAALGKNGIVDRSTVPTGKVGRPPVACVAAAIVQLHWSASSADSAFTRATRWTAMRG